MDLQIYIDTSDIELDRLQEIQPLVTKTISNWISEQKLNIKLLPTLMIDTDKEQDVVDEKLGIHVSVKSKFKLKEPLNFLYSLAKSYKCEFIIAMVDSESGDLEEVCYFGFEEGRPDLFEIANYLSL